MSEKQNDANAGATDAQAISQASIDRRAWPPARQWQVSAVGAVMAAVIVLALWLGNKAFGSHELETGPPPPPAGTFRPTPQQLKTLTIARVSRHAFVSEEMTEGKIAINADHSTPVFSPYSGRVIRVIAGLGDAVKAGAALATIDASEFVQAQNDLNTAAAQVKLARINESRKHSLYDAKGGSLQDWQQAQNDLTTAEVALSAVRNRLRILGLAPPDIDALEHAGNIEALATLRAPVAGVVVDRQVGPGQYLQSGSSTPQFTIADTSSVWLLANVRESDSGLVKLGQPVEVRVLAYPKRTFDARVTYVSPVIDAATHRLPVRAEIANRDGALKPEMFANFRIFTSDASESPAVPDEAVVYEGDAAHVWMALPDGTLTYRAISTGRHSDGLVEVTRGLAPGDQVVTRGSLFIDQAAASGAP
jgi:cobalt-zinc-cadmium efflux system membrane fusion protein